MGLRFSKLETLLVRALLVLTCAFMAYLTFIGWRLAQVFNTINQSIAVVSNDVAQVTHSASRVANKVDEVVAHLETLEARAKDAVSIEEVANVISEVSSIRDSRNGPVVLDDKATTEIKYLLNCVRDSHCQFGHDEDIRSASNYYIRLNSQYVAYKVATRTIGGNEYFVVLEAGTKRSLNEWLMEKLSERRKNSDSWERR